MRKDYSKKKHKSHKGDNTAFDYNFLHQKSTSEPDLSDSTPRGTDRWTIRFPHEFITVDELAYYRRRKPPDQHTKSSICLYNKSEPSLPFSAFKSEYNRRYTEPPLTPRRHLERRSTSLKLDGPMTGESESTAVFHPYTDSELLRCRPSMIKLPQNLYLTGQFDMQPEYNKSYGIPQLYRQGDNVVAAAGLPTRTNYFPSISPTPINTIRTETSKSESALHNILSKKNSLADDMTDVMNTKGLLSRKCNLRLEGELTYLPEYRSQFIKYPIEKSHSIPQLSNIKLHGEFTAVPEYRANYKIYDNFTKSAPIKKKDNLYLHGSITGMAEYTDNYKTPLMPSKFKSIKSTESRIGKQETENFKNEYLPEYYESYKHPHVSIKPERAKPKEPFLSLRGKTEYNPEYRCTYLDFPRSRHIVKKPDSSFKLTNSGKSSDRKDGGFLKKRDSLQERRLSIHDVPPATNVQIPMDPNLPFVCLPEYRKVKNDLQIRERRPMSKGSDEQPETKDINNNSSVTILPEIPKSGRSSGRSNSTRRSSMVKPSQSRTTSPTFRLLVENVDDHRGTFRRSKSSPKFGRRSLVGMPVHPPNGTTTFTTSSDSEHIPATQSLYNLRNRTRVIEGNPNYVNDTTEYYKRQKKHVVDMNQANSRNEAPSFIVLKEPCKQSGWMRPTWYDS